MTVSEPPPSQYITSKPAEELKTYTRVEIAKHSTKGDAWMIIGQKVYDVTNFNHPGGFHSMSFYIGGEGTRRFLQRHSIEQLKVLDDRYLIGKVAAEPTEKITS